MIIVHVYHNYWPIIGGLENAVRYLAEEQVKLGHEVHVVVSNYGVNKRPPTEELCGVTIHRIKSRRIHYPDLTIPIEIPQDVINLLKRADVVHGHSQNSSFVLKILKITKKFGPKVVMHYMAIDTLQSHPSLIIRLLGPIYANKNLKSAIKLADIHLARSKRDLQILLEKYNITATYLPDGINDYFLTKPKSSTDLFKQRYNITHNILFSFIGRIHKLKGIHVFVRALSVIPYKDVGVLLIGPDNDYLENIIKLSVKLGVKNRLYYLGFVDEDTKIDVIDSSLAIVLPSLTDYVEVYPMVISEAWARSTPVIASTVGGIPYRVKNKINGLLVPPNNHYELANALTTLIENPSLISKMGERGKKEVKTWNEIARLAVALYRR